MNRPARPCGPGWRGRLIRHSRGVSLIEALVAMAVMAFGAAAVVGLQATLRLNGDIARQRAEAVRLAQVVIEDWRGFQSLSAIAATDWADVASGATPITGTNTTFTRTVTVVASGEGDDRPKSKTVHVRVTWLDRTSTEQRVELNTIVAGSLPELAGSVSVPFDKSVVRNPEARHPAIPPGATDIGGGQSSFAPPGGGSLRWIFSNTTGLVTRVCLDADTCSDVRAMLLSGFVRFSTGSSQPTPAQAENPTSSALPISVFVNQTVPTTTAVGCFEQFDSTSVAYFCLLPVNLVETRWSGTPHVVGIPLASHVSDDDDDEFKVCRYTTVRDNDAVVPTDLRNVDHPRTYALVDSSLTQQNYLVIRAGNDSVPFVCPDDNTSTPRVNTATWYQDPRD